MSGAGQTLRLDKWLWQARFAKTRSLAARLCAAGLVRVGGATAHKPAHPLHLGDIVSVPRGRQLFTIEVVAFGTRRGPPAEARTLYRETAPPAPLDTAESDWTPLLSESEELV
jgi:ribosome-associated heat shock protein Hsp15